MSPRFVVSLLVLLTSVSGCGGSTKPNIKVSKATTFLTGPLDAEGFVDYAAAIDQAASQGITVEDNFEVALCQLVGPAVIPENVRSEYFKRLGIEQPPSDARYFEDLKTFLSRGNASTVKNREEEFDLLRSSPWSATEHPLTAEWLEAIGPQLDRLVEATKRPRSYPPYLARGDGSETRVLMISLSTLASKRELSRSLLIRAYSRLHQGDVKGTWSDLAAVQRLARLICQGPFLIEDLAGKAIEAEAFQAHAALLQLGQLTAADCRLLLTELQALTPLAPFIEKVDRGERLSALDVAHSLARSNGKSLGNLMDRTGAQEARAFGGALDWNTALKIINTEYDRSRDAYGETDLVLGPRKRDAFEEDLQVKCNRAKRSLARSNVFSAPGEQGRGEVAGIVLVGFMFPGVRQAHEMDTKTSATLAVTRVAYAVELYHLEHGLYPKSLADLAPAILNTAPVDPATGRPLRHRIGGTSRFIVYSVGNNQLDDEGQWSSSANSDGDDIAIEGPPSKME